MRGGLITVADVLSSAGVKNIEPFGNLRMPFALKPHQIRGLNKALTTDRSGLFFEARTGKTICFQLAAIYCANYGVRSIILMPPILFDQFLESWEEIEGDKPPIHVMQQGPAARDRAMQKQAKDDSWPDIQVMTKEIFKKVWGRLKQHGYQQLIFDESHLGLMKDITEVYKAVKGFCEGEGQRLILSTGTPIPSGIEGAYPAISLINSPAYFDEAHFYRLHVEMTKIKSKNRRGQDVLIDVPGGYKDLGRLHANLYKNAVRATKREVLDMAAPNVQVVPFSLSPAHLKMYQTLMKQRVLEIGEKMISAIQAQKLRHLALQMVTSPDSYSEKKVKNRVTEGLEQLLHSAGIDKGEKVFVCANYIQSVETVAAALKKYNPATVYGPNGPAKNATEVKRFQTDRGCQVLVANPQAGGVGLKLGHVCTTVIFAEPVGSPGAFDQALSRVILEGQKNPVVCYVMKIVGTISPKAIDKMRERNVQIKQANRDVRTLLDELQIN